MSAIEISDDMLQKLNKFENSSLNAQTNNVIPDNVNEMLQQHGINPKNIEVIKNIPSEDEPDNVIKSKQNNISTDRLTSNKVDTFFVTLPSEGKLYPPENSFHGIDQIRMRKINIFDDDILNSPILGENNTMWSTLLKSVFVDTFKHCDPDDLFDSDRTALIVGLRAKSYGNMYNSKIKYKCDYCTTQGTATMFEWTFDLSQLRIKNLSEKYIHSYNDFKITLPSDRIVVVKIFTIKDRKNLKESINRANAQAIQLGIDRTKSTLLKHRIVALDDVMNPSELNDLLYTLEPTDIKYIEQFVDKAEPQLDFKQIIQCPLCNGSLERNVLLTDQFLDPAVFDI